MRSCRMAWRPSSATRGDGYLCTWKASADWHASWVQRKRVEGLSKGKLRNYEKRVRDYGVGLELADGDSDNDEDEDPSWARRRHQTKTARGGY